MLLRQTLLLVCAAVVLGQDLTPAEDVELRDERPRGERAEDGDLPPPRRRFVTNDGPSEDNQCYYLQAATWKQLKFWIISLR